MDRLQGSFWFDLDSVFDHLLAYYQSVIKTFFTLLNTNSTLDKSLNCIQITQSIISTTTIISLEFGL